MKCPEGQYYCFDDEKCKPIPEGKKVRKDGELVSEVAPPGYGHTKGVKEGDSISMNEADEMLEKELIEYENYVDTLVTVPLTDYQRDALISWTYNLGPTNLKSSTLLRKLNEGDYDAVPHEMMRWTRAGGKELEGLVKRRTVEANMFQGEYVYSILR